MEECPTVGTRVPKRTATQRKCLKCDERFRSKSKHHRLCDQCKGINEHIADVELDIPWELRKKLLYQRFNRGEV